MSAGTMNLRNPRHFLSDAILAEIRSWAELPRKIFTQFHYAGKSVEEIASQSGYDPQAIMQILEIHDRKLRKSLKAFRIG